MSPDINLGEARAIRESERALLVELVAEGEGEEVWVPKSVISDDSECYSMKSGEGDLIVARWWAEANGHG